MKAIAILVSLLTASTLSGSALAQTGGLPPVQPPAGDPAKFRPKSPAPNQPTTPDATQGSATPAVSASKPALDKRAARKAKRAEKVGDKPID